MLTAHHYFIIFLNSHFYSKTQLKWIKSISIGEALDDIF